VDLHIINSIYASCVTLYVFAVMLFCMIRVVVLCYYGCVMLLSLCYVIMVVLCYYCCVTLLLCLTLSRVTKFRCMQ